MAGKLRGRGERGEMQKQGGSHGITPRKIGASSNTRKKKTKDRINHGGHGEHGEEQIRKRTAEETGDRREDVIGDFFEKK
jgi:hypothetical protein